MQKGNGEVQPPPGFSPFLSPEHIDLLLPPFGTRASPWPWQGLLRVRGAGRVWGGGRRTLPREKPLTRQEDARRWQRAPGVCKPVRLPPGPRAWVWPRIAALPTVAQTSPAPRPPPPPLSPPGCALRSQTPGLDRTAPRAVLEARGGVQAWAGPGRAWSGRRRGTAARGKARAERAAAAAVASFARPPQGLPAPRIPHPQTRGQRARSRRRLSALPWSSGAFRLRDASTGTSWARFNLDRGRGGVFRPVRARRPGPAFTDSTPVTLLEPSLSTAHMVYPEGHLARELGATFSSSAPLGGHPFPFVWDCLSCKQGDWSQARPKTNSERRSG